MNPQLLRLKGFIGIRDGLGLDEITLDLSNLPGGIVALVGENGKGKTTIIDNLTPFRIMASRMQSKDSEYKPTSFSFYDQCYGEAEKEFIFTMDGEQYRSLIQIDVDRKRQEAYLSRWKPGSLNPDDGTWVPLPGIDGKLDSYDRAVESICGSPQLFYTGPFRAQGAKALSDYTKGDIKEILTELLGIEGLQAKSEKARRVKQFLEGKMEILRFEQARLREEIGKEDAYWQSLAVAEAEKGIIERTITDLQAEADRLQQEITAVDVQLGNYAAVMQEKAIITKEVAAKRAKVDELKKRAGQKTDELTARIDRTLQEIAFVKKNISGIPMLREKQKEKAPLEEKIQEIGAKIEAIDISIKELNQQIGVVLAIGTTIREKEKEVVQIKSGQAIALQAATTALANAERDAGKLATVPCGKDLAKTCRFVKDAVEAERATPGLRERVEQARKEDPRIAALTAEIEGLRHRTAGLPQLQGRLAEAEKGKQGLTEQKQTIDRTLKLLNDDIAVLPALEAREAQLPQIEEDLQHLQDERTTFISLAAFEVEGIEADITDLENRLAGLTDDTGELQAQRAAIDVKLAGVRADMDTQRANHSEAVKQVGAAEAALAQIEKEKAALAEADTRAAYLSGEIGEWGILEKGLGQSGIIALEIDDAGPQISTIANQLLQVHGGRFSVRIDTQSQKAGNNKGTKEDFDISVFDNQSNTVKSFRRTSGGEKTLLDDALTKAICVYNRNASGINYDTLFTDEKDGALDSEKKKSFFDVKREVLRLGGYTREFTITHTPELVSMADAVIELRDGGVKVECR